MAPGEMDGNDSGEEPAGRPLLPLGDRVWRHPAEVALAARQVAAHRRSRKRRAATTILGGVVATAGLLWLTQAGPTDVSVTSNLVALGSGDDRGRAVPEDVSPSLVDALVPTTSSAGPLDESTRLLVLAAEDEETLAGALRVREGFVITSGRALAGATEVVLVWGSETRIGTVVGYDETTDVSVIRLDRPAPGGESADTMSIAAGDIITLAGADLAYGTHTVVNPTSTSARENGEPVVGIVELDGTLGEVPPGGPAFDANGAIIGMVTATAEDAPAAIVPIELVRVVADEIIDLGAATHPRLGLRARNPDAGDNTDSAGSLVTAVTADGPAERGGVEVGDLIVEVDGSPVESMEAMVATLRTHEPGDVVVVVVRRGDESVNCSVELGSDDDSAV